MNAGFIYIILFSFPLVGCAQARDAPPKLTLTPDARFTVFEGPMLPDGRIDYIAAMNARDARLVAHQDNAFRSLLLLVDAQALDARGAEQYQVFCELLAITDEEIATSPKMLLPWMEYAEGQGLALDVAMEVENQVYTGDFSHDQIGLFKRWLEAQQPAIDAAVSACMLPEYWRPTIELTEHEGSGLIQLLPLEGTLSTIRWAMRYHASAALEQGDVRLAAEYAIALRHMAAHRHRGPFLVDAFVGDRFLEEASDLFLRCVHHSGSNRQAVAALARRWLEVPDARRYHEILVDGELIWFLNRTMSIAANRFSLDDWGGYDLDDSRVLEDTIRRVGVNLDALVLRNDMRLQAEAARLHADTYVQQTKKNQAYKIEWGPRGKAVRDQFLLEQGGVIRFRLSDQAIGPEQLGRLIVDLLGSLRLRVGFGAEPVATVDINVGQREFMSLSRRAVSNAVAACMCFYIDQGRYPARLSELVPAYLPALPVDPIDGKPLRYRLNPDGSAAVYSIYLDLDDDGGLTNPQDAEVMEDGDYAWQLKAF